MKKFCIAVIFLVCLCLSGCNSKDVDLSDFAEVSFQGMDGKGTARINFEMPTLEKAVFTPEDMNRPDIFTKAAELEDSIKYSISPTEKLSNGDKVTITITWDSDVAKKYKLNFTQSVKTVEVSGLKVPQEIDVFQDVHIEYEGISPYAQAIIKNKSSDDFVKAVVFVPSKSTYIGNGDIITLTASYDEKRAENEGYIITQRTKAYEAEGIDEYISQISQISKEAMASMEKAAVERIEALLAAGDYRTKGTLYPIIGGISRKINDIEISDIRLTNAYLLSHKRETGTVLLHNNLFLVYEIEFKTDWTPVEKEKEVVYVPVFLPGIILRHNGEIDIL